MKVATSNGSTKSELQRLIDDINDAVQDALDPSLTREDVIGKLQEIDELINGDEDDDDEDDDDEDHDDLAD